MDPTTIGWIAGIVIAGAAGWLLGKAVSGGRPTQDALTGLAQDLRLGRRPATGKDAPEGMAAVRAALDEGWTALNEERERALGEALGRIAAFLRAEIRGPLEGSVAADESRLRDGVRRALGALDDLDFFLREPLTPDETHNVIPIVQQVTREFTADWEVAVRLQVADRPVRARIHHDSFMDAFYLLLHNAGRFGGGKTVDVVVSEEAGEARVSIRDQGDGFTEEALQSAHDLFYTTTESALGLGIPFARKIIESFGGDIELKNRPDGEGAEVTLSLPVA